MKDYMRALATLVALAPESPVPYRYACGACGPTLTVEDWDIMLGHLSVGIACDAALESLRAGIHTREWFATSRGGEPHCGGSAVNAGTASVETIFWVIASAVTNAADYALMRARIDAEGEERAFNARPAWWTDDTRALDTARAQYARTMREVEQLFAGAP